MYTDYIILKNIVGVLSLLTFLSGFYFLLFPFLIKRLPVFLNRAFSVRRLIKPLEIMIIIDDRIYKIRRILGLFSLLVALTLVVLQFGFADYLILKYMAISLSFLNFTIGIFLLFFPHILKRSESFFNKWFSLRNLLKSLEIRRDIENVAFKKHKVICSISFAEALILLHWFVKLRV